MRRITQRALWSLDLPAGDAYRRATGRARLNAERRAERQARSVEALALARAYGWPGRRRGVVSRVAAALGLSRQTVSRYLNPPRRPWWLEAGL